MKFANKINKLLFLLVLLAVNIVQADNLEKILITGAPQDTELQNLPSSVSVLDAEDLNSQGRADFFQNQIITIPNLNTAGGTSRPRFFQIRGIGELEQYEGAPNSSVAVIVDDVDLTGVASALTLFDVNKLEVHRGPQAVRFGSSALAGAIYLNTESTEATNSNALLSAGSDSYFSAGLAAGSSLSDNLNYRLAVFSHYQDGFRKNDFLNRDDTNERDEYTAHLKFTLKANPSNKFTLSLLNTKLDNGYDAFSIFNGFHTQSDKPGQDEETLRLISLKGISKLSRDTTLTSITSYYRTKSDYSFDGDWGNNAFWEPYAPYDFFSDTDRSRNAFAQQFSLNTTWDMVDGKLEWLNGLYFRNLEERTTTREFADDFQYDFLSSDYKEKTLAAFTNFTIPLSKKFKLGLGGRIENREMEYRDSNLDSFSPDDLMFGGQVNLQYLPSNNTTYYLLVSRGFKGGGFNAGTSIDNTRREYNPESLVNFETGNRSSFLNGDLKMSVSSFLNLRRDQQVKLGVQSDPTDPLTFAFLTDNAASGRSYGLETEIEYILNKNLLFNFSGSLLDTEITEADNLIAALKGRDQSHAPNWQYAFRSEYFFTQSLSLSGSVTGQDAFYFDDSHNEKSSSYALLNTKLSYLYNNWEFSLWGQNLTDKRYAVRGFFFGNEPPDFPAKQYVQLGDGRIVGITARYSF